jgi:2-polyprenyl-6-methoxyphenol hydroxylase-like FAD-dependent oxidoreductase
MKSEVLIVGAGPTGLTAAVELARRGIIARVVDKKQRASTLSRAVGVNARTLHLLRESGVTDRLIEAGIKITEGVFFYKEKAVFRLHLGLAPKPFDYLLALPQDVTEKILIKRFEELGGRIEFDTEFKNLVSNGESGIAAEIQSRGHIETIEAGFVLGADGIRSRVRESAEIEFSGIEVQDEWSVIDFDSVSWPFGKQLTLFIYEKGRVCLIIPIGKHRYRGVTDRSEAAGFMPSFLKIDRIRREGSFAIWVKQAATYQSGRVFLAGDAAHSHSPVGGRGMNLGIADAVCFARLLAEDGLADYTSERHPAGKETLVTTERGRKFVTSTFPGKSMLIRYLAPFLLKSVYLQRKIASAAVDYPL